MAWGLPDLKGALVGLYEESIKPTIEAKSIEYKALLQENFARGANTQKAMVTVALGVFLLLALNFFWKDSETGIQWKYLLLGLLTGAVSLYVVALKPWEFNQKLK